MTGASSDIGRAVAEHLLADGWHVTGLYRIAPTESIEGLEVAQVDMTDFARLSKACDGLDAVDAFVHAAGFMRIVPLGVFCAADDAAMWHVYVDAVTLLADRLMPRIPTSGHTLLTNNRTANGVPTRSQYAVTKTVLVGMACLQAAELAPRGTTVNVITPDATGTPFLHDPARAHTPPRMLPIGRLIAPEEVAAIAVFQAGEYGSVITGQQIVMCGGVPLQRWRVVRRSRQSGADARWLRRTISLAIFTSYAWLHLPMHERRRSLDPLQ